MRKPTAGRLSSIMNHPERPAAGLSAPLASAPRPAPVVTLRRAVQGGVRAAVGAQESDDDAYADEHIGENHSGAALNGHGARRRFASMPRYGQSGGAPRQFNALSCFNVRRDSPAQSTFRNRAVVQKEVFG